MCASHRIFITGGTGYLGTRLIPQLLQKGHSVRALTRSNSTTLPAGCEIVEGNALQKESYTRFVPPADTFIHMIGVPKPSPAKAQQFRDIDLVSLREAVSVATDAGIRHFMYLSVAQPAPVMRDYVRVRAECEDIIRSSGLNATFVRPWYVLGPGHRWPYPLLPVFKILEYIPSTRDTARRLGFITLKQMIATLVSMVEHPAHGIRIVDVASIRSGILPEEQQKI